MEDKLNDTTGNENEKEEKKLLQKKFKWPLEAIIFIVFLIVVIIGLIIFIIIYVISNSKSEENKKDGDGKDDKEREIYEKAGYIESWNDLYGIKMSNLSYVKNDTIINSFKKDGDNYNESIWEINDGKDYPINERNNYSLYIPYSSLIKNNKSNGIFLFIHGGSWVGGNKEDIEFLCRRYAKIGYITATMGYTVLSGKYPNYNIYRILDEITACIENIKEQLENLKINSSKLEVAIGGVSAGAHISLLYGYLIKKTPLPVKFLINIVGPLSLEPQYWYKPAVNNQTLDNLEKETIEEAIKNGTIIKIFEDRVFVGLMNEFLGNIYSEEDIKEMIVNNTIDKDNPKYQEMFKKVQNSFPLKLVDNYTLPTLCEYGGNDSLVGVAMFGYLKELFVKYEKELDLAYMRYGGHELISYYTKDGIKAMREIHYNILDYAQKFFNSDE